MTYQEHSSRAPIVLYDVLPNYMLEELEYDLKHWTTHEDWDVYDNVFESKLQLKKRFYYRPAIDQIMEHTLQNGVVLGLLQNHFQLPDLECPNWFQNDYHTALFKYRPGDRLHMHLDCAIHEGWRKALTANLYLSDCSGGELVLLDPATGKHRLIRSQTGTLVVFANTDNSFHAVLPVASGERLVLTYGYVVPESTLIPDMLRTNTRAIFVPQPGVPWTPEMSKTQKDRKRED